MGANRPPNMTPEDAIYDMRERMVRMETVLTGVPGTEDKGLVGKVSEVCDAHDETRKKVGRLEWRFWLLIGLLAGSGTLGGIGIAQLFSP